MMLSLLCLALLARSIAGSASPILRRHRPDTFKEPRAGVRWRHWIQDAYIEDGVLQSDVEEMAKVGSEGLELLSYQSYGERGPTLEDPTIYSYGSELFGQVLKQYAIEAKKNGLYIDWAMGPNQAAGVPYPPEEVDALGFNTELVMGRSDFLEPGSVWNDTLPDPVLVPLTGYDGLVNHTAPVHDKRLEGLVAVQLLPTTNRSTATLNLDWNTVEDLTNLYSNRGSSSLNYTAKQGQDTLIIAFYSRRNGYPEAVGGFDGAKAGLPGSWGSFVHDHFSVDGAEKAIESNTKWVLSAAQEALNDEGTGIAMWTDSNEFRSQLYWTEKLAERFQKDHGYSITPALPVLFGGKRPFSGANTPSQVYDYGASYDSERFRNDYKQTLTNLYLEYGHTLTKYARSIGLKYSDQPAYNFPLDVGAAATVADIPECESLGQPSIDLVRQFTGGVNLAGRKIFSSEMGAGQYLAYESTMAQQIHDARMAFAAGVNQIILHGYPSSTNYKETSWPGLTPFVYEFSELHGPRQPAWRHYGDYMEMLGREMWMLRKGTPKIDLAVLRYGWDLDYSSTDKTLRHIVFKTADLTEAGYSYEYVSSYALNLRCSQVQDGRFAPSGPSYKALVVNRAQNLTVQAADTVLRVASQGLPVIILGDVPTDVPGYDPTGSGKQAVASAMSRLLSLSNVLPVDQESDVPDALSSLGAFPSASIYSGVVDYPPVVRKRSDSGAEFYYIFNQGKSGNFSIGLENPFGKQSYLFVLDQRTGETRPAAYWQHVPSLTPYNRVNVTFQLQTNQSILFVLSKSEIYQNVSALPVSISSINAHVTPLASNDGSKTVALRSSLAEDASYVLSNGSRGDVSFDLCGQESLNLTQWHLLLQSWTPTSNLSSVATKVTNSSYYLSDGLVPWDELEGHYNTSGVGIYTTNFTWVPPCNGTNVLGAELRQPLVQHTQRAWLNGKLLPLIDPVDPRLDISPYLETSSVNTLVIEVASPLLNALNALDDNDVESVGYTRAEKLYSNTNIHRGHGKYGLFGIEIVPIAESILSL